MKKRITKTLALLCAVIMMLSCLTLVSDAAIKENHAVGQIVYLRHVDTAPNMEEGVIDETWGDMLIHLTKDTKNGGLYKNTHDFGSDAKPEDNTYVDLWAQFDDEYMYFAMFTNDISPLGGEGTGDSVCFMLEANNKDLAYIAAEDPDTVDLYNYHTVGTHLTLDDFTPADYDNENRKLTWLEKDGGFYVKFRFPFSKLGIKLSDLEEGVVVNFNFMRGILNDDSHFASVDGWIYWGKWYNKTFGIAPYYVHDCDKAKSPNSFIFKKANTKQGIFDKLMTDEEYKEYMGVEETTPTQPTEQPATPAEQPSDWAKAEVDAAIAAGLVPADLQNGYKDGTSRETLSKLLSVLLDKVYGKSPEKTDAAFSDTTDADVLKAANLGIINGYANGDGTFNFKPANTLKRSEMTAIINRVAKLCGKTVEGFDSEVKFADTASHWCNKELGWAVHQGIVKGTSATTFSPENTLTVEQSIMMIYRTFEALK